MNAFLNEHVPDPTDFPADSDAPGLRALDEAFRCTICRELFEAPVTVNCSHGHCFCSLCIREQMNTKQECPLCRQTVVEAHIRRNPVVEDMLKAWKAARPFLLELLEKQEHRLVTPNLRESTPQSELPRTKRKRRSSSIDDDIIEVAGPSSRSIPSTKPSTPARPISSPSRKASAAPLVHCPICNEEMSQDMINVHLDNNCQPVMIQVKSNGLASPKKRKTQKQEWSRLFGSDPPTTSTLNKGKATKKHAGNEDSHNSEPIPKMAYDTLTAKTIRERLTEYSLPTEGEKPALVLRHQRWVTMFNANLDASPSQRKTLQQLRKELKKREDSEVSNKTRKSQPQTLDVNTYEKDNRKAFAHLVEQARPKSPRRTLVSQIPDDDTPIKNTNVVATEGTAPDLE